MSAEKAKLIREQFKKLGINSRQVSVTAPYYGSIRVSVKDLSVNIEQLQQIASQYETVHYCHVSQEILSGGNTFVSVSYDWKVLAEAKKTEEYKALEKMVEEKLSTIEGNSGVEVVKGFRVFKNYNGNYQASAEWEKDTWSHLGYNSHGLVEALYIAKQRGQWN